jgi:hypothetical protein
LNWFDLTGIPCLVFEPEPLEAMENIDHILSAAFKEEPLETYFCEQSTVPSPWNTSWTNTATEGGRLDINDPVYGLHWAGYSGVHSWFP